MSFNAGIQKGCSMQKLYDAFDDIQLFFGCLQPFIEG